METISKQVSEFSDIELENYMQNLVKKLEKVGHEWAEKKSVYEDLDDKKKTVLAAMTNRVQGEKSNVEKERLALGSVEYKEYLDGVSLARKQYLKAQVDYDMGKLKIDTLRTILATRREAIKNFKG